MKIVFLDIDGPMIPSYQYILKGSMASVDRQYSHVSVAMIKYLCSLDENIRIVFNSYHNVVKDDLLKDTIRNGLARRIIHKDFATEFPNDISRLEAIEKWLAKHNYDHEEGHRWVAFDDELMESHRAIWVDPDAGLNLWHINKAARLLDTMHSPNRIMM